MPIRLLRRYGCGWAWLAVLAGGLASCGPDDSAAPAGHSPSDSVPPALPSVGESAGPGGTETGSGAPAAEAAKAAVSESAPDRAALTAEALGRLERGMAPAAVEAVVGVRGAAMGGDGAGVEVLRYADDRGNYFTARFDHGALRTHSSLRQSRNPAPAPGDSSEAPEPPDNRPMAQIAPGVFIPLERAVAASSDQPQGIEGVPRPPRPSMEAAETEGAGTTRAADTRDAGRPGVVVLGDGGRADRAPARQRSYRPRARLPEFTRSLREGVFKIRFYNPGETAIAAGIRQADRGLDITVPPGGQVPVHVDRGTYALFFIRESEPYTRYEANPITIDGIRTTALGVRLDPEDVELNYEG